MSLCWGAFRTADDLVLVWEEFGIVCFTLTWNKRPELSINQVQFLLFQTRTLTLIWIQRHVSNQIKRKRQSPLKWNTALYNTSFWVLSLLNAMSKAPLDKLKKGKRQRIHADKSKKKNKIKKTKVPQWVRHRSNRELTNQNIMIKRLVSWIRSLFLMPDLHGENWTNYIR